MEQQSFTDNIRQESLQTAKQLAPWRAGLPWWVVLIEGVVMGLIGVLILFDPRETTINVALFMAAVLVVAGIVQLVGVMRGKAPETADALIAARGALAVFAGGIVLLLFFLDYLTLEAGLIVFGLGSLIYGLTGFGVAFQAAGPRRRSGIIEGVFFSLFGVLLIYVLFAGGEQVHQAARIVGWAAIVGGLLLIGLSFYNRSRDADREEKEQAAASVPQPAQSLPNREQNADEGPSTQREPDAAAGDSARNDS